jgi:hypothetical protein
MLTRTERHAIAQHHVAHGQRVIESQLELIRKQNMLGYDTKDAEKLLAKFEPRKGLSRAN